MNKNNRGKVYFINFRNQNKGMTFIELIVVLSIFAIISSVSIFSYKKFQANIDMKNLASDIAYKLLEAQKNSVSGKLSPPPPWPQPVPSWKPSYGVYFNLISNLPNTGNTIFYSYVDLNQLISLDDVPPPPCSAECLEKFEIKKNSYIYDIIDSAGVSYNSKDLQVNFTRPASFAVFYSSGAVLSDTITWVDVVLANPELTLPVYDPNISPYYSGATKVRIWRSGRIEVR